MSARDFWRQVRRDLFVSPADRLWQARVAGLEARIKRLTVERDNLITAGREALTSLDELIADHPDPGTAVHGSRHMLAQALLVETQDPDPSRADETGGEGR